jgi:hypothetical protein
MAMKSSNSNWESRDFQARIAVPQPTAPPRAPIFRDTYYIWLKNNQMKQSKQNIV